MDQIFVMSLVIKAVFNKRDFEEFVIIVMVIMVNGYKK